MQMGLRDISELPVSNMIEISNSQWLSSVFNNLKTPEKLINIMLFYFPT